jgi:hypothetical protein
MTKSARSIFVFAIYLYVLGIVLILVPNTLLSLFSFRETDEVWIRVLGVVVLILGFYYSRAARKGLEDFFRLAVFGRTALLLFFIAFVLADFAPPVLILFGVIDFAGAMWTAFALRSGDSGPGPAGGVRAG